MKKNKRIFFYLFLLSIFLFKIPNFYLSPFLKNPFLTTQALARILAISTFIYQIFLKLKKGKTIFKKKDQSLITAIFLFFFIQSLSVLVASNILSFLIRYKDVIISLISFTLFYQYRTYIKQIFFVLVLGTIFSQIYQLIIFFYPEFFVKFISTLIYQKHAELVVSKLTNSQIYTDTYDEAFFSLILASYLERGIILLTILSITSFLSNIRTRILMLIISILASLIFIKKIPQKLTFLLTFIILFSIFITNNLMQKINNYSFINRFTLSEIKDKETINFRFIQTKKAIEIGKATLLGVGLGNYYDYINKDTNTIIISKQQKIKHKASQEFVHNIFGTILAETGYISLSIFLVILIIFIKKDLEILKSGDNYKIAFAISFWILFIYGLFNPITPGSYQFLFWGIRGLLF